MDLDEIVDVRPELTPETVSTLLGKMNELLQDLGDLSVREKVAVVERLRDEILNRVTEGRKKRFHFSDWIGAGAYLWRGVDIETYINELRDSWNR